MNSSSTALLAVLGIAGLYLYSRSKSSAGDGDDNSYSSQSHYGFSIGDRYFVKAPGLPVMEVTHGWQIPLG